MNLNELGRYFIHGFAFSVIMIALFFLWAIILVGLIAVGFLIGLIIGLIFFFFIIGGLNSLLTNIIWSIPIKTAWMSLLGHGIVLSILLIIVHIPSIVIGFGVPSLSTTIVLFVVNAFIDGLVAKNVAGWWKEYECIQCGRELPKYVKECPHCASARTRQEKKDTELPKICPKCGKEMWLDFKTCPRCGEYLPE